MEILFDIKNIFLPEFITIVAMFILMLLSMFTKQNKYLALFVTALSLIIALSGCLLFTEREEFWGFNYSYFSSLFTVAFKSMALLGALGCVFLSAKTIKHKFYEYCFLILSATLGTMCLISCNDFLSMFISIELISISCYFLVASAKGYLSKEASLKYFFTGAAASAVLLMGISYVWGVGASLNFNELSENLAKVDTNTMLIFGETLLFGALAFKIGAVPFMNWVSDTYQGASYAVGAFLSTVPKIAGFAIFIKLAWFLIPSGTSLQVILFAMALLTLLFSNLLAARQMNFRRFLAYSAISHSGFMLLALAVLNAEAVSAVIFNLMSYLVMNLTLWAAFLIFYLKTGKEEITDFTMLIFQKPFFAFFMILPILSLAGMPPTIGFISKFYLFMQMLSSDPWVIYPVAAGLLVTVIGIFYYFRIIFYMFKRGKTNTFRNKIYIPEGFVFITGSILTVILCIAAGRLIDLSMLIIS